MASRKYELRAPQLSGIGQGRATEAADARGASMRSSRMCDVRKGSSSGERGATSDPPKANGGIAKSLRLRPGSACRARQATKCKGRLKATFFWVRAPFRCVDGMASWPIVSGQRGDSEEEVHGLGRLPTRVVVLPWQVSLTCTGNSNENASDLDRLLIHSLATSLHTVVTITRVRGIPTAVTERAKLCPGYVARRLR
jgi:hypothetical protein